MDQRPDVSKYEEAIEIVRQAQVGHVTKDYQLARVLGPLYPTGIPSLRAIWAAQDLLVSDPERAAVLLAEHCIAE